MCLTHTGIIQGKAINQYDFVLSMLQEDLQAASYAGPIGVKQAQSNCLDAGCTWSKQSVT